MRPIGDWSMSITLSRYSRPVTFSCAAGEDAGAVEVARGGGVERVDGEASTCPSRETPVTQVKVPSGIVAVTFLRLLAVAPWTVSFLPRALAALGGERDRAAAGEIIGGEAGLAGEHLVERAVADDLAAMDAGAGAHVDDIIGVADRVLVMLDDEHGVAEIAQALERDEQAVVVALVEADRGLVEDVEHAREAGADLAGEADALALAAARACPRCGRGRDSRARHC